MDYTITKMDNTRLTKKYIITPSLGVFIFYSQIVKIKDNDDNKISYVNIINKLGY